MKKNIKFLMSGALALLLGSACTTGGFDENPQLDKLNDAIAFSPKVTSVTINGEELERNTISIYQIDAKIGDVLSISAEIESGKDAQLEELFFEQTLFSLEIEEFNGFFFEAGTEEDDDSDYTFGPIDAGDDGVYDESDASIPLSGSSTTFTYDFTVFDLDPWFPNYEMHAGDFITVHLRVRNSLDNMAYQPISIHIVE